MNIISKIAFTFNVIDLSRELLSRYLISRFYIRFAVFFHMFIKVHNISGILYNLEYDRSSCETPEPLCSY